MPRTRPAWLRTFLLALLVFAAAPATALAGTAPTPPVAVTDPADVGSFYATLHGTVNPSGSPTTYHFNWGTSPSVGASTPETGVGADDTDHAVSWEFKAEPGTTFY